MAEKFLAEGAKVLITGRRKDKTDKVAAEIGSSAFAVDVSICCDFSQFISHCVETMGQLDTLVLNAGISLHEGDILNVTPEQFDAQMSTNLRGAYFAAQAFVKYVTENSRYEQPGPRTGTPLYQVRYEGQCSCSRGYCHRTHRLRCRKQSVSRRPDVVPHLSPAGNG